MEYRMLKVGEVIQEGDEIFRLDKNFWEETFRWRDIRVPLRMENRFRRPLPSKYFYSFDENVELWKWRDIKDAAQEFIDVVEDLPENNIITIYRGGFSKPNFNRLCRWGKVVGELQEIVYDMYGESSESFLVKLTKHEDSIAQRFSEAFKEVCNELNIELDFGTIENVTPLKVQVTEEEGLVKQADILN